MKKHIFTLLLSAIIFTSCKNIYKDDLVSSSSSTQSILITEVRIFNGKDQELSQPTDILIQNGKIKSISSNLEKTNAKIINGKNKTLIPGLIDAHVHLSGSGSVPWENIKGDIEYNLQAYLYAGITTVYDLGGLGNEIDKVAKKVESSSIIGPSIYHTHIPITVKNSHPIPLTEEMLPWPLKSVVNSISPTIKNPNEATALIEKYSNQKTN